jgi:hypothetical protein
MLEGLRKARERPGTAFRLNLALWDGEVRIVGEGRGELGVIYHIVLRQRRARGHDEATRYGHCAGVKKLQSAKPEAYQYQV